MHQINVLILGPKSFISTLDELKPFLKFNFHLEISKLNYDALIYHKDALQNSATKEFLHNFKSTKICFSSTKDSSGTYNAFLQIPSTLKEINSVVENTLAKKYFNKNSSIKIKKYLLDKNEKKIFKNDNYLVLTEKEIQLLELFLNHEKPISKNEILSRVWHYSSDADTHTVETHIYRLRKKISEKFSDENFILNHKQGYHL